MANKERKALSLLNWLNQNGYPVEQITDKDGKKKIRINPIASYSPNKEKFRHLWSQYDLNQYCSFIDWEGLPNGVTSWNLNRMLYYRGSVASFVHMGKWFVLPYVISGDLNVYGMPTKIRPIAYNGGPIGDNRNISYYLKNSESISVSFRQPSLNLPVNKYGSLRETPEAFILYDNVPFTPAGNSANRFAYNQCIIDEIAETLARVNISVKVSNKKILFVVPDETQRSIVQKEFESLFSSDSPFGVITSPMEVQSVQQTSDFNASDLFNVVANYDAIRCFMSGIQAKNFGTEKKERLTTGELAGNEEQIDLIADMRFSLAKFWADQNNEAFGTNIRPIKRTDSYKDHINGNGKTQLEEEEEIDV